VGAGCPPGGGTGGAIGAGAGCPPGGGTGGAIGAGAGCPPGGGTGGAVGAGAGCPPGGVGVGTAGAGAGCPPGGVGVGTAGAEGIVGRRPAGGVRVDPLKTIAAPAITNAIIARASNATPTSMTVTVCERLGGYGATAGGTGAELGAPGGVARGAAGVPPRAAPHCAQNWLPSGFSA